ncbi:hypothetical protein FOXB_10490 [Fusarium oxysporum f. sp. conglutinans Fo5176]|uniref:Uncharacterized protein n=1 Tax=Fusarium oxysporum (strain Fo5176) TaxID=660025 RepID=F9FVQ9_FUSOF|nr:hypothetical protein FOXB_10490 [Fusarium oxysporum f. sp. conglutinans Fo5176]
MSKGQLLRPASRQPATCLLTVKS